MRKLMVAAMAIAFALGSLGIAKADPGPNGNNDYGLCTAYFNGQKKGWGENAPPPFAELERQANEAGDPNNSTEQNVYDFCRDVAARNSENKGDGSGIGGNPDHGRFPDCFDNDDCNDGSTG